MEYGKSIRAGLVFSLTAALFGCSTGGAELQWVDKKESDLKLVATASYLPVQEKGDEGQWLPYEPQENPYIDQSGRVAKDSVTQFVEARRAFKAQEWERAKALLNELVKADDGLSGPWVMLGDIASQKGEYQQATDAYVKAIAINGENVNAYLRLALAQRKMGRYLHSQNTYAEALKLWPDYPEAHLNLAVLYDIYLNHPIRAQKHMEAYQFLTGGDNAQVASWLEEIRSRTGIAPSFEVSSEGTEAVSYRPDEDEPVNN